jgi:2-amino-4-hydroxy-6-hydroxymethyldihydropteridine diphosphokinase/dihydropteroate synthase
MRHQALPMKAVHQGIAVRGRALTSRNVSLSRIFNVNARISIPLASTRHQSTATDRLKASPWSQHPLPVSIPLDNDPNALSKQNLSAKRAAYIALGSNLGDRIGWIEKACNEMSARGIKITRTSSLWETEPMYVLDQDSFVNGVCEVSFLPNFHMDLLLPRPSSSGTERGTGNFQMPPPPLPPAPLFRIAVLRMMNL